LPNSTSSAASEKHVKGFRFIKNRITVLSGVPRNFVQQIQCRENGDLRAVAPIVRGSAQFANE
jgi:hypothetical protein